ncbi:MAG: DUF1624 domain-containing protein [Gammaproteobacteria bacterium]
MPRLPERLDRLVSVDLLRGLVMVIMALDHTRDFFTNAQFSPTDLSKTSVALFLTRWITHFCAPVFVFLAGTGAFLYASHGKTKNELAIFLITRGLWLIFLQIAVETFAWDFTTDYTQIEGGVLWAIGWSMIALAGLVFLPVGLTSVFGILMIASHNLLDGVRPEDLGELGPLWAVLHTGDIIRISPNLALEPFYPLIPWIGVMAAGYGFGTVLLLERDVQRRVLLRLGGLLTVLFILLRSINLYGDPKPWSPQDSYTFSLLSFLNCEKYPPSLLYLLMTLGPAIAVLPWFDRKPGWLGGFFITFGRVPLFYYLLHLLLIHQLVIALAWVTGRSASAFLGDPFTPGYPDGCGYDLPILYLLWVLVVLSLYPICRRFASLKAHRRHWRWLRYL